MATHVFLCDGAAVGAILPFGDQSRGCGSLELPPRMSSREHCLKNKTNLMLHFHCATPTQQ